MTAVGWSMVGLGLVLVWAGIRNENAYTVAIDTISGKRKLKGAAPPVVLYPDTHGTVTNLLNAGATGGNPR